jgi:predicted dehydrogenase
MKSAGRASRPRLGFLGVGWIGRHRLEAIAHSGFAEIAAIADLSPALVAEAGRVAPKASAGSSLADLLAADLDGLVIATPSALHAEQAITALDQGLAVFCQKPLGRTALETHRVVEAARAADRLLGVDFSYRYITGMRQIRELCQTGELGDIYAVELAFHNAYGPDKPWFYDWKLSGGGCVIDLGIHLVDLALWSLGFPEVENVSARLFAQGQKMREREGKVEDYAVARLDLETGATVQIGCSWKLPAGCDALIRGAFYGTKGGAGFHNRNGSFYHFDFERFAGTKRLLLTDAEEEWGGRAAVRWAQRLGEGARFDPAAECLEEVAQVLDAIYATASAPGESPEERARGPQSTTIAASVELSPHTTAAFGNQRRAEASAPSLSGGALP